MKNFTLIVPTHNRHNYLKRSMEYFKDLDAEVIYCDSSRENCSLELYDNIKYLHFPDKGFGEKILLSLKEVKTDYVALCADDDFIIIDSLYKGVDFLTQNKNFKTVVGDYVGFNSDFDNCFFQIYQEIPEDIDMGIYKNTEVFFQNYYQILWAMYDLRIIEKSFKIIQKAKFFNENYIELVIGSCACYEGGIKFLDVLWGVREISNNEHWGTRHQSILNMKIAEIKGDYVKFKELVDNNTCEGYAELVLRNYITGQEKRINYFRRIVSSFIPRVIKKYIRTHIIKEKNEKTNIVDSIYIENLKPISRILSIN